MGADSRLSKVKLEAKAVFEKRLLFGRVSLSHKNEKQHNFMLDFHADVRGYFWKYFVRISISGIRRHFGTGSTGREFNSPCKWCPS